MSGGFLQESGTWPAGNASADLPVAMPADPQSADGYSASGCFGEAAGLDVPQAMPPAPQPQEIAEMPHGELLPPAAQQPMDPPKACVRESAASGSKGSRDHFAGGLAFHAEPIEVEAPPMILHIRCPAGHMLKTPREHLGKHGRCPACNEVFELRYENSLESQRREEKSHRRRTRQAGLLAIVWPFLAAILLFALLVGAVLHFGR